MSLGIKLSDDGKQIFISMPERFAFEIHSELRKAYSNNKSITKVVVDLSNTSYLDSSALGMLLQLREHAGDDINSVKIVNAKNDVKDILKVANFGQ